MHMVQQLNMLSASAGTARSNMSEQEIRLCGVSNQGLWMRLGLLSKICSFGFVVSRQRGVCCCRGFVHRVIATRHTTRPAPRSYD